jgi:hypothetical protein
MDKDHSLYDSIHNFSASDDTTILSNLIDARIKNQFTPEEKMEKCEILLSLINQATGKHLHLKSPDVFRLIKFPIIVTKMAGTRIGSLYATRKHKGMKIANFLYVPYEEKFDAKNNITYYGMINKPYSRIDWSIHQARLKVLGYEPNGLVLKDVRRHGVFAKSNVINIIPTIKCHMKQLWKPPISKLRDLEQYKFESCSCDYTNNEGVQFIHEPPCSHSLVMVEGVVVGLAGCKKIQTKHKKRDSKTKKLVEYHKDVILTDWIPLDPNNQYNKWQDHATTHVLEHCK